MSTTPLCNCGKYMRCTKNGKTVNYDGRELNKWNRHIRGDEYTCPECGNWIIANWGSPYQPGEGEIAHFREHPEELVEQRGH